MADYVLDSDDITTLSSNLSCDDFVMRRGLLHVNSNVTVSVGGDYVFDPTSSVDAPGLIFQCVYNRLAIEGGAGDSLNEFKFYDLYTDNESLFFPCVIIEKSYAEPEASTPMFGGEHMLKTTVELNLVFKKDFYMETGDGRLGEQELAEWFLFDIRKKLTDIEYRSDLVRVGDVFMDFEVHVPKTPQQSLYGFSIEMTVDYKEEEEPSDITMSFS